MNYFYAYTSKDKSFDKLQISKDCVYIDTKDDTTQWEMLLMKLKPLDKLYISSIKEIGAEEKSFYTKLNRLKESHIELKNLNEEVINIDILLEVIDFIDQSRKEKAKQLQKAGIEKALEKKYKGEGAFGRPRAKVPDDFEENIKKVFRKEMTHETYREMIGMKRSTYYKIIGEIKESLLKEMEDK